MPRYKMLVFTNPAKGGSEENYNKWYNEQHIPDVCRIEGFTGAQRFKNTIDGMTNYLAIYEVDAPDAAAAIANLTSKAGTDEMIMSDDLDIEGTSVMVYEELTEPYTA
ncbi:MAG: hypothetical protein KDE32_15700 [Novosphingobium sp.]|nr:hypothetical protein [Novosphingobium sp.]